MLPFSLLIPQSLVKQLSRGQDAAHYILTMQLVIISLFSFHYNSGCLGVNFQETTRLQNMYSLRSQASYSLKLMVQFPTSKRPIPLR